jgi:CubicO group peptidase (beta-lactamase class C family)
MHTKPSPRSTPAEQGVAASHIVDFANAVEAELDAVHSFMLVRHGFVVAEAWWHPYSPELPHLMYSVSKSFTATAIGIAVGEGLLSIDDRVIDLLPDDAPAEPSANLAAMTVRHLLMMASGHAVDTADRSAPDRTGNWAKAILAMPVEHAPGTVFIYNSGATYLLSAILNRLTGERLLDYLTPRILEPLGISDATWEQCPRGIDCGGWGMAITTESLAALGQLYLQRGLWEGKQLVPAAWVDEATAFQIDNSNIVDADPEGKLGYGYQFWRSSHGAYRADGAFGQLSIVFPEQDAVLAITTGVPSSKPLFDLVWKHIVPALEAADLPGPADLGARALATQTGARSSSIAPGTYPVMDNPAGFTSITLSPTEIRFDHGQNSHTIPYAYGDWVSHTSDFLIDSLELIAASGAWTDDTTFVAKIVYCETPYVVTATIRFDGDEARLSLEQNVAFLNPDGVNVTGQIER